MDGPTACAFMSVCKRFTANSLKIPFHLHLKIRLKPRNNSEKLEALRKKLTICERCFVPYYSDKNHVCASPAAEKIKCNTCSTYAMPRDLRPWCKDSGEKIPDFYLRCVGCDEKIDVDKWLGIKQNCMTCGIRCDSCFGLIKICEYCGVRVISIEMKNHIEDECTQTSWQRWVGHKLGYRELVTHCNYCSDQFLSPEKYHSHLVSLHFIHPRELTWSGNLVKLHQKLECPLCDKWFTSVIVRQTHIELHRQKSAFKNFHCPDCKNVLNINELYSHKAVCQGLERPTGIRRRRALTYKRGTYRRLI